VTLPRAARFWLCVLPVVLGLCYHASAHLIGRPAPFQDDMRQHILGLQPTNDLFGHYFAASVPPGVRVLDWITSRACSPLDWARWGQPLLSASLLAAAAWGLGRRVWAGDNPDARAHKSLLLVWLAQALAWSSDDLVSGTPRGWSYFFSLWIFGRFLAADGWGLALALGACACFYPPVAALMLPLSLVLALRAWRGDKRIQHLTQVVLAATLCIAPVIFQTHALAPYGPKITRGQALEQPEFHRGGRAVYFDSNPKNFWVTGARSGFVARDTELPWLLLIAASAVAATAAWRSRSPVLPKDTWTALALLLGIGAGLFLLSHALWFRLFHPSRYAQFAVLTVATVAGAGLLGHLRPWMAWALIPALFAANAATVDVPFFSGTEATAVHSQLAHENGKKVLIAAFPGNEIASTLPLLSGQATLCSVELALPYHTGFYRDASARIADSLAVWSSSDSNTIRAFVQGYGITHFYLDPADWPEHAAQAKKLLPDPWRKSYATGLKGSTPLLKLALGEGAGARLVPAEELLQKIDEKK